MIYCRLILWNLISGGGFGLLYNLVNTFYKGSKGKQNWKNIKQFDFSDFNIWIIAASEQE